MDSNLVLSRLRRFLLVLAGVLLVGTFIELVFTNHTQKPVQLIPFFLCILGTGVVILALINPHRRSLLILRASMVIVGLGSLLGIFEHVSNNIAFFLEINPGAAFPELLAAGLGGANPLVAPGILAVGAVLALAATYAHPGLARDNVLLKRADSQPRIAWGRQK